MPHVLSLPTSRASRDTAFPYQVLMLTRRNLLTIFRTPEALLPPIAISVFFLVIYQSTLGTAAGFIPSIGGDYLGFILPLSIVSASLAGAGIAAQNLVRDIERGYFDKLLLTPVSRAALLLSPILAGALILGLQTTIVLGVALLLGLEPATGWLGTPGRHRAGASCWALALPASLCRRPWAVAVRRQPRGRVLSSFR